MPRSPVEIRRALACRALVGRWAGERSKAARADGDQPAPLGGHAGCTPDGQHPGPRAARARRRHRDVAAGASEPMDSHSGSRRLAERLEQPVVHADVLAPDEGRRPDLPGRHRRARASLAADSRLSTLKAHGTNLRGYESTRLRGYESTRFGDYEEAKFRTDGPAACRNYEVTRLRTYESGRLDWSLTPRAVRLQEYEVTRLRGSVITNRWRGVMGANVQVGIMGT